MSSHLTHRRSVAGLLLGFHVIAATGCTSWKTSPGSVETVLAAQPEAPHAVTSSAFPSGGLTSVDSEAVGPKQFESIRVSFTTGASLVLNAPHIANDTLYGRLKPDAPEVAIPVADVTSVQTRQGSTGKTVALIVGIAVPVGLIVGGMIALSQMDCIGIC